MKLATIATCNLNQWAMDFEGNMQRIVQSIRRAKELLIASQGARLRVGPELEVTGYGCEDHFLESDTFLHSWEVIAAILSSDATDGILCDIGLPIMHRNVRYNCRLFALNRKLIMIKPKMFLASDGNYRENRWFQSWEHVRHLEDYYLPRMIREITQQETIPIGDGAVALRDTAISAETCEELFTPAAPHIYLGLNGIEILGNGSGSHHQLRKLHQRVSLIASATEKTGGIYLYANQRGCDGGRLYFDGCAMIFMNGKLYAQGSQFAYEDVEVITATLNLEDVRTARGAIMSRGCQAAKSEAVPRVNVNFDLTETNGKPVESKPIAVVYPQPEEEIAHGPSCWLWDYLRRSKLAGFFLPLSGGADSSAVATIVGVMCRAVHREFYKQNQQVISDLRTLVGDEKFVPDTPNQIANRIFYTCYMGSENSSVETQSRAKQLATEIGSYHLDVRIDTITQAFLYVFEKFVGNGKVPKFKAHGGSETENLALQNIQARTRMVLAYMLGQLVPWSRGCRSGLLILGSANVDESLRGYLTKYDCSSADLNPIGGISKTDLKLFLKWAAEHFGFVSLRGVLSAAPTAELEPITANYTQTDEADMGMTYDELSVFGRLRKVFMCGPVSMYEKLCQQWTHLAPATVAEKVKRFFFYYSINRHKATTITPAYHAENYSTDDNRFDLRQFLYNAKWPWQFRAIDTRVQESAKRAAEDAHGQSASKKTKL